MSSLFSRRVSILPTRNPREGKRQTTYPLANSSRKKDRRWPLVLRFSKGSIHGTIWFPVFVHTLIAAFVVWFNQHRISDVTLPSSIIPSLSIVVGLMLVFRNQTAYSRFWGGRMHINKVTTAVRCLSRQILVLVPAPAVFNGPASFLTSDYLGTPGTRTPRQSSMSASMPAINEISAADSFLSRADEARTIETVKILIAMLYTIKNHLRAEWGVALSPGTSLTPEGQETTTEEYKDLLPQGIKGYEHRGLGLTLQLSTFVEDFIRLGVSRKWIHNAASASMLSELNALVSAYGNMEVIRLVPIPVAHLIHHKQTLALFCGILPFAMASEMDWWCVPLVAFVSFTLYGIEGIAQTYEDPFGEAKIDINMDDIVEDARREVEVMLAAWQTQGNRGGMFRPTGEGVISGASSISEFYAGEATGSDTNLLKVTVSNLGQEIERDRATRERQRRTKLSSITVPGSTRSESGSYSANERSTLLGTSNSAISPGEMAGNDYMGTVAVGSQPGLNTSKSRLAWADRDKGDSKA